jgi:16S rRNA (guanine966-N2)-methyltransferase
MRVIAGQAKGTRLAAVPAGVRPVSDRAREGVFSSLASRVLGSVVLDLYAGTGAMGIEALSRGAERATFVDRSRASLRVLRENLARTKLDDRATVVGGDVLSFLMRSDRTPAASDLVFMDPPYDLGSPELDGIVAALDAGWLAEAWTVVLTRGLRSSMPVIPVHWAVARRLEYGDSLVVLYREDRWA